MKIALTIALAILATSVDTGYSQGKKYELPKDKEEAVITMGSSGGFRIRAAVKPEPLISIYPDGRVVAGKTNPNVARSEWKLKPKELTALLDFCIKENELLKHTSAGIKAAIDGTGKRVLIADAPNTDIMINVNNKPHKISVYALFFVARQFGDVDSIKQVAAVEKRLKKIQITTVVGGPEALGKIVKLANEEILTKDKKAPKFKDAHVNYAQKTVDGKVQLSLSQNEQDAKGVTTASFSVQVVIRKDADPLMTGRVDRRKK